MSAIAIALEEAPANCEVLTEREVVTVMKQFLEETHPRTPEMFINDTAVALLHSHALVDPKVRLDDFAWYDGRTQKVMAWDNEKLNDVLKQVARSSTDTFVIDVELIWSIFRDLCRRAVACTVNGLVKPDVCSPAFRH